MSPRAARPGAQGLASLPRQLLLIGVTLLAAPATKAQVLDDYLPPGVPGLGTLPGVTVLSRLRPDLEPLGTRLGAFVVRGQFAEELGYDDNISGSDEKDGALFARTTAEVRLTSDWSRHAIDLFTTVDDREVLATTSDVPDQSRTNWTVSAGGELDIGRDRLRGSIYHYDLHQDPTDLASGGIQEPLAYEVDGARVGYDIDRGRIVWTPQAEYTRWRFGQARLPEETVNQSDRDRDIYVGQLTARYDFAPQRSALGIVRAIRTNYVSPPPGGPDWDSNSFSLLGGLDYLASGPWRYRALVGLEARHYTEEPEGVDDRVTPVAELGVVWTPTGLTTVTGSLVRTIQSATDVGEGEYEYTRGRVAVDHEYLRNILLNAHAGFEYAEFAGDGTSQTVLSGGLGVTWLVNRRLRLGATYEAGQKIGASGDDYNRNIYLVRLEVGF